MSAVLSLTPSYYEALKRLTLELAGVQLGDNHEFLIESRLSALARREGFEGLNSLIEELFATGQSRLAIHVVSALLERDTHFNDDYGSLNDIVTICLPSLYARYKGQTIRILSYGCSSGQESYSLAIAIHKARHNFPDMGIEIIGVDYPSLAIDRARTGRYTHFEVQRGLPIRDLITYFDPSGEDWIIKDALRNMVQFKDFHLLSSINELGTFHISTFRNKLDLYSSPAQVRIMRGLANAISPYGFLVLGHHETLGGLNFGFDQHPNIGSLWQRREIIIEEPIDPTLKVPTERTTFESAKRRHSSFKDDIAQI
ncbi:MAG: CheR family methyltransferase [Maricaulaceae bacterium]